jgi:hypothetical protein
MNIHHEKIIRIFGFERQVPPALFYLLIISCALILGFWNAQMASADLLLVNNDFPGTIARGLFFLENPAFTPKWFNGESVFFLYAPLGNVLPAMFLLLNPNPSIALELMLIFYQLLLLGILISLAREMGRNYADGLFSFLVIMASSIITGRFFISGRLGEFFGLALCILFLVVLLKYARRKTAGLFIASILIGVAAAYAHVLSLLLLPFCLLFALIFEKVQFSSIKRFSIIGLIVLIVSAVFWLPFVSYHYSLFGPADEVRVRSTGSNLDYTLASWGLLALLFLSVPLTRYIRSWPVFLLAILLVANSVPKLSFIQSVLPTDFKDLKLDGSYYLLDNGPRAAYSVLAFRGFKSSGGDLAHSLPLSHFNAISKLDQKSCASLDDFAKKTSTRYFIDVKKGLERCGYSLIYSRGIFVYDSG